MRQASTTAPRRGSGRDSEGQMYRGGSFRRPSSSVGTSIRAAKVNLLFPARTQQPAGRRVSRCIRKSAGSGEDLRHRRLSQLGEKAVECSIAAEAGFLTCIWKTKVF